MSSDLNAEPTIDRLFQLAAIEPAPHLYGDLRSHLLGTWRILAEWGAGETLQRAGLIHATYGTEGFTEPLLGLERRVEIASLVGDAAEALVYFYAACVRDAFYGALARGEAPIFIDRFIAVGRNLDVETIRALCELTAANEAELLLSDPAHGVRYGLELTVLFTSEGFRRCLSLRALAAIDQLQTKFYVPDYRVGGA